MALLQLIAGEVARLGIYPVWPKGSAETIGRTTESLWRKRDCGEQTESPAERSVEERVAGYPERPGCPSPDGTGRHDRMPF
jgi:hypothetical protein